MKLYTKDDRKPHAFDLFFTGDNPKYLVVGSFPTTEKKMSFNFFYPNPTNKFWKVLSKVFPNSETKLNLEVRTKNDEEVKQKNKLDRQNFCRENKIAMTDILKSCIRMDGNSKDEQLLVHCYNPILEILETHKTIDRVILTAKSSGASAHHHFYQYLAMKEKDFWFELGEKTSKGKIEVEGRTINIFSMYSTSSRNSHATEDELVVLYKEAFNQTKQ